MSEELIRLYLLDITREIDDIIYFTDGYALQTFLDDIKTQKAVIMSLLNIGELVKSCLTNLRKVTAKLNGIKLPDYEIGLRTITRAWTWN